LVGLVSKLGTLYDEMRHIIRKEAEMQIYTKNYIVIVLLLVTSLACGLPINFADSNAISTAAAQTVIAGLTQNASAVAPVENTSTATATFTVTPEAPTETLSPTVTLTTSPVFTSTSLVTLITVSVPTNCRIGPGKVYGRQGALLVGQVAEVFGRDPSNRYWFIRNPDNANEFCWVWGEYATLTGPFILLPVFTPPPTPTPTLTPTPAPNFEAKVANIDVCGKWWADIEIKNTGAFAFKSVKLEVLDTVTDIEKTLLTNGFINKDGCLQTTSKDVIGAGETFVISSDVFDYDISTNKLLVNITLCTDLNQKGVCITKEIKYKP
jgi:hypothetical protein